MPPRLPPGQLMEEIVATSSGAGFPVGPSCELQLATIRPRSRTCPYVTEVSEQWTNGATHARSRRYPCGTDDLPASAPALRRHDLPLLRPQRSAAAAAVT